MKDNFSAQSANYAKYRPTYPDALFDFLMTIVPGSSRAWDCGTGNGQVAIKLADYFERVDATDISRRQLQDSFRHDKVQYSLQPAEKTTFQNNSFDLVTVGQAVHWFDFEKFYSEVRRTVQPGGILAVMGYGLLSVSRVIDQIIFTFYHHILGNYWDKERRYVSENYQTIPFPFVEVKAPRFKKVVHWSFEQLVGFLNTVSARQHFIKKNGLDPVSLIYDVLKESWGAPLIRAISFPILFRVGQVVKG